MISPLEGGITYSSTEGGWQEFYKKAETHNQIIARIIGLHKFRYANDFYSVCQEFEFIKSARINNLKMMP